MERPSLTQTSKSHEYPDFAVPVKDCVKVILFYCSKNELSFVLSKLVFMGAGGNIPHD